MTTLGKHAARLRAVAGATAGAVAVGLVGMALPGTATTTVTPTSLRSVALTINAPAMWNAGFTGKGADIAIIDTGVAPVAGLNGARKLFHGPDLSFESQTPELRYYDTYGHGTNMAGIAAGKDPNWTPGSAASVWSGIAPDSKILSVKIGDAGGAADITQMIAAIYWVVEHRRDNGLNIRVLNLSYGTDEAGDPSRDGLFHAVEVATRAGILVVASSGNIGFAPDSLNNPAAARMVLAVGATNTRGTTDRTDDSRAEYTAERPRVVDSATSIDTLTRGVDAYAPGSFIEGPRVPGSFLDGSFPGAISRTRFFRGSGTSQAAAVVSGAAALLFSQRPSATPVQIKSLLKDHACPRGCNYDAATKPDPGADVIDLKLAKTTPTPDVALPSSWLSAGGTGIGGSRGTSLVTYNGVALARAQDIFGKPWDSVAIAKGARAGTAWNGGTFNGSTWAGTGWSGNKYATAAWPNSWAGVAWSDTPTSTPTWSAGKWLAGKWLAGKWLGTRWAGDNWSSAGWR